MLYRADDDPELGNWLNHKDDNRSQLLLKLIEAARLGNPNEYTSLQPLLRRFRACDPEPGSSIKTHSTDAYKVVFNEQKKLDKLDSAFAQFNAFVFDNTFPETKIRYATLIENKLEPSSLSGCLRNPMILCPIRGRDDTP